MLMNHNLRIITSVYVHHAYFKCQHNYDYATASPTSKEFACIAWDRINEDSTSIIIIIRTLYLVHIELAHIKI